jgi:hypothetical protein
MNHVIRSSLCALALTACSAIVGETPVETIESSTTTTSVTTTSVTTTTSTTVPAPVPRDCTPVSTDTAPVSAGSVAGVALLLSAEIFPCADDAVVVPETNLNDVATAAQLAAALGAPLLHPHPQLAAELARLAPLRIYLIGKVEVATPRDSQVLRPDTIKSVAMAGRALDVSEEIRLPAVPDTSTIVETIGALTHQDRVVLPQTAPAVTPTTAPVPPMIERAAMIKGLAVPSDSEFVWMVPAGRPLIALSAAATGRSIGASVVAYDPSNVLGYPRLGPALAGRPPTAVRFVGTDTPASAWAIDTLIRGVQVPGGGFQIFPRTRPRRYVAFYGHPVASGLGALGEQGPTETLARMQPLLADYAADGAQVIPTFEIIASIASAGPTDGDYSEEWPPSAFAEWIKVAQENGMYVILDLQPGREDFLKQAKQYEELLKLPFVGLALDPEWRLQPDQVHLRQIGSVNAAEVNRVVDWLAALVRDNGLPQKMLIVHQFKSTMIVDRETLKRRPELQMVIQMDGQGPIPTKDETYAFLTSGTEEAHWRWGWKNFFDEDSPETASPAYTIDHSPVPVFVSYQ